jgi:hypothetical protein
MRNHIIFFSGGQSSFVVADYVKKMFPNDQILLYFTDTLFEDEDLYRFIYEVSDKLELPLLIHADGLNPLEYMEKENFLYNSMIANCSKFLKVRVAERYLRKGIVPKIEKWYNKHFIKQDNFTDNPILYFGITFMESHRSNAIIKNWQPFEISMPLMEKYIDVDKLYKQYNIEIPRLYKLGFSHNNCGGRCIKGGQGHWLHLLKTDYKAFEQMRDFELMMNSKINIAKETKGVKYSFLKRRGKNYTLRELENDYHNRPNNIDIFDIGGCGCFIDESDDELCELK